MLVTILCTSAAQIFQKRAALHAVESISSERVGENMSSEKVSRGISPMGVFTKANSDFLISLFLLGSGLLLWMLLLTRLDVSVAYPILSLNYVIVLLCAKWLFGESVPSHRWVGALAIVAGIVLMLGEIVP